MSIERATHYIYTVQPGDTVYSIAARLGSSVQMIEQSNHLFPPFTDPSLIFPGQMLVVPSVSQNNTNTFYIVGAGDRLHHIALRFSSSVDFMVGLNPNIFNPDLIYPGQQLQVPAFIYRMEPSDSLYKLETRFGIHRSEIIRANIGRPGFSPDVIWQGYTLIIPLPTSNNIGVFRPLPGTLVRDGQQLSGIARAFEATVLYQIQDANGVVVSDEKFFTASEGAPAYGRFHVPLEFDRQPTTNVGEIRVYTRSAATGDIQDLVKVRVFFETG